MTKYPGRAAARSNIFPNLVCDPLQAVLSVCDRQVMIHDWKRIAVDHEVLTELHTFFLSRQIFRAQEARAFRNRLTINRRRGARYAMGNVANEDVEPIDPHPPCIRPCETFNAFRELRPCPHLPVRQFFYFANHLGIRA